MLRCAAQRCTRGVVSTLKEVRKCASPSAPHASIFLRHSNHLSMIGPKILSINNVETLSHRCLTTSSRKNSTAEGETERENNKALQSSQMNKILINGLELKPEESLQEAVMNLFKDIGVLEDDLIVKGDIKKIFQTKNGNVICTFREKDAAREVYRSSRKNLPPGVFLRQPTIRPFREISYQLRVLFREKKIQKQGFHDGIPHLKLPGSSEWIEISRMQDLVDLELITSPAE